jgi:hypothetical protein
VTSKPRLRRQEASAYLLATHGIPISRSTLEKMAVNGGGPSITYFGRIPLYDVEQLDAWAMRRLRAPVASTSEKRAG